MTKIEIQQHLNRARGAFNVSFPSEIAVRILNKAMDAHELNDLINNRDREISLLKVDNQELRKKLIIALTLNPSFFQRLLNWWRNR